MYNIRSIYLNTFPDSFIKELAYLQTSPDSFWNYLNVIYNFYLLNISSLDYFQFESSLFEIILFTKESRTLKHGAKSNQDVKPHRPFHLMSIECFVVIFFLLITEPKCYFSLAYHYMQRNIFSTLMCTYWKCTVSIILFERIYDPSKVSITELW